MYINIDETSMDDLPSSLYRAVLKSAWHKMDSKNNLFVVFWCCIYWAWDIYHTVHMCVYVCPISQTMNGVTFVLYIAILFSFFCSSSSTKHYGTLNLLHACMKFHMCILFYVVNLCRSNSGVFVHVQKLISCGKKKPPILYHIQYQLCR